eukprot:scaffold139118_cov109-Phaeocystis_antarctica.AAC.1
MLRGRGSVVRRRVAQLSQLGLERRLGAARPAACLPPLDVPVVVGVVVGHAILEPPCHRLGRVSRGLQRLVCPTRLAELGHL